MRTLLLLVAGFTTVALAQDFNCEPEINVMAAHVTDVPQHWTSWNLANAGKNNMKKFKSLGIYEGHPDKSVQLAPDNADSKDNFWAWTFAPVGEKRKDPIWLACEYEDTTVILARSLPLKVQKCRVDFNIKSSPKKFGPVVCE